VAASSRELAQRAAAEMTRLLELATSHAT
jgi:hypothetical protein